MATRKETVDDILDQVAGAGEVSARAMFGEYGVYCNGRFAALICDDTLFIKPTAPGRAFAGTIAEGSPYPGAKSHLCVEADLLEDADRVSELLRITAEALPAPKPKKPRTRKNA